MAVVNVERWTCDQQVVGCDPTQVKVVYVPLSSSSITLYQPMGGDAMRLERYPAGLAESNGSLPPCG